MKSWRTTMLGIVTGVGLLAAQVKAFLDNDPSTVADMTAILAALAVMGFGWAARDNSVSSEKAGAK